MKKEETSKLKVKIMTFSQISRDKEQSGKRGEIKKHKKDEPNKMTDVY